METSTQKATYFSIQQLALTNNEAKSHEKGTTVVNPLSVIVYLLVSVFFLLTSSTLYAQNDRSTIPSNSWDANSLDSIVKVAHLDSAEAFRFWQSVQDSINTDSVLDVFNSIKGDIKPLNDSLTLNVQDSATQELFSGVLSTLKNVFANRSSLGERSPFGVDIRTNVPVAILSIPNSFYSVEYSSTSKVAQGDGQKNVVSTFVDKPVSFGFRLNYSLNANMTASLSFDKGILSGIQDNVNTSMQSNTHDFKSFTNSFKSYGVSFEGNLINMIFGNGNLPLFNSWFTLGFAYVDNDVKAYRCDGRIKSYKFMGFATTIGIKASYSVIPSCDFICGSTLYMLETAYMDGVYIDNKNNDKMLLNFVGVSYNFGSAAKRSRQ